MTATVVTTSAALSKKKKNTWIESGQTLLLYLDELCEGSPDWHARLCYFQWSWPWNQGICLCFGNTLCTAGNWWPHGIKYWKYGILWAAEDVVRAGVLSYAPGSESAHMFHLSHFHRLVRFCWFGLVVGGVCLCFFAFLLTTDQPVRSSYQPMTIIAYLHDCHCRYDERSNVQKKKDPSKQTQQDQTYPPNKSKLAPRMHLRDKWKEKRRALHSSVKLQQNYPNLHSERGRCFHQRGLQRARKSSVNSQPVLIRHQLSQIVSKNTYVPLLWNLFTA